MSSVHVHLLLNHVPVIGMLFVVLVAALALWRDQAAFARLALAGMAGLAVVSVMVFLTGEPAEDAVEGLVGISESMIHAHEEAAEAALVAAIGAGALAVGALAWFRHRALPRWVMGGTLGLALGVGALMGVAANRGGQIRHSEIRMDSAAGEIGAPTDGDSATTR